MPDKAIAMPRAHGLMNAAGQVSEATEFAAMSARRLFVLGGIGLILTGMIFGDIFAVFTLHQNAARVGSGVAAAAQAALAGNRPAVFANFQNVGGFLENRGTKVDTHVHMIDFGYLALLLALLQPWVALGESAKKKLAWVFLVGAWLLRLLGLWKHARQQGSADIADSLLADRSFAGRVLFVGGLALVLLGFLHGAYYAAADLYRHEARDYALLSQMSAGAAAGAKIAVDQALGEYGQLQGHKAVNIAAHAHAIEFGLLAILLAFFQPYVSLSEVWQRRWAAVLLLGSLLLPVCVLLEVRYGLVAGGIADFAGLLVIIALLAMWIGILRYTGALDASSALGSISGASE